MKWTDEQVQEQLDIQNHRYETALRVLATARGMLYESGERIDELEDTNAELLAACEALLRMIDSGDYYNDRILNQARVKIAKARGGA